MSNTSIREYNLIDSCVIYKTKDTYGDLSNMASGYSIQLYNSVFKTSEALYQVCKFPNHPEIQQEILSINSPMTAKMKAKKNSDFIRKDWDSIRVAIMRWALSMKLCHNYEKFSTLLLSTGERTIVENSKKDDFWGAKKVQDKLIGTNALGRLLMELRAKVKDNDLYSIFVVAPPNVPDVKILGELVTTIDLRKEYLSKIIKKLNIET
ncbi:MAG: hypothetical protein SCALA702_00100 [Melioribacteraceae bacterium]|nr:MAG: hypothetical protein SCALA702_00100 [Melioribacteraceae bacterium]